MIPKLAANDPFGDVARQFSEMMHSMQKSFCRFSRSSTWQPAVNVYEDEKRFYLCVELAGLKQDQIHVDVLNNQVRISGEREVPAPPECEDGGCILRMEIDSGLFERTIELPAQADMDQVDATLTDGFLWITIGKRQYRTVRATSPKASS